MAFIDKKDPIVLNIKITSKGRELLSEGKLDFKYYAIGDSEIDYSFTNINPFYNHILKPTDKNPNIISFIPRTYSGDPYNLITNVPSTPSLIQNTVQSIGFFTITSGTTTFITDGDHVKQPDAMVMIDNISGGTTLNVYQASTYLANINEPIVGDFILIKWSNKLDNSGTTGYNVSISHPTPYLIYKIQSIISGSLFNNNLVIEVDRELPNFSAIPTISGINAGALIFYNYINYSGDTIYNDYSTNYESESTLAFLQNCLCPTIIYPYWNLSIVYTEELVGVQNTNKGYEDFTSNLYAGFVSYIQNQAPIYKKLGIIHYTNSSPSNTYGEEFYINNVVPTLDIPTIMWHLSSTPTLGVKLTAYGSVKMLTGTTKSLNISYYDLADSLGNVVGKVFTGLKIFVIEDQELLFAMSYKSNRSWTLPNYTVGVNDNVVIGCPTCNIDFVVDITTPTTINANDGSMYIHDIVNQIVGSKLILSISGATCGQIYFNPITGNTQIINLSADTYQVIIHDLNALNCQGQTIIIPNPTSLLSFYETETTQSGLDPDFNITIINPTTIRIYKNDVGTIYGTGYTGILAYNDTSPVSYSQIGTYKDFNLSFLNPYTIYVKDVYTGTTNFIITKDYVAAGNPLNSNFIISNQATDSGGTYVIISNYLTTISQSINPIVGEIEFRGYNINTVPTTPFIWQTLPTGSLIGSSMKIYINNVGNYNISVRERYQTIEMYKYSKSITII